MVKNHFQQKIFKLILLLPGSLFSPSFGLASSTTILLPHNLELFIASIAFLLEKLLEYSYHIFVFENVQRFFYNKSEIFL